ncbi:MAG: oxygen-dependent coproporphyrinogen oxidase [Cytophagaceae bacterium]
MSLKNKAEEWFKELQDKICAELEKMDGAGKFAEDQWIREEGGGGRSRAITDGRRIEKGGVNFSAVYGKTPEKILKALNLSQADFYATGISLVLHPQNPWSPVIHMNLRYFEMSNGVHWFGGGIDLTPHYVIPEDAVFFHQQLKNACDRHNKDWYKEFKKWADNYFFIDHRNETRGIGGIFFDRLSAGHEKSMEQIFEFVKEVGNTFLPTYLPLMQKNSDRPYSPEQKQWQYLRRGRYVEFNLVYDKGTKFGLDTNGRTESILMSMPPLAGWKYNFQPEKSSEEQKTLDWLKKDMNWIA